MNPLHRDVTKGICNRNNSKFWYKILKRDIWLKDLYPAVYFWVKLNLTQMQRQKKLRKSVTLTDFQSQRLHELSEFDGLDPAEHTMRAINEYLKKQHVNFTPPKETEIMAEFKKLTADQKIHGAFWVSGTVGKYEFSALILQLPAKSTIDKGKISKLAIWDPIALKKTNNLTGSCIVNYDRGWDIRPSKIAAPFYDKVKTLLDQSAEQYIRTRAGQ